MKMNEIRTPQQRRSIDKKNRIVEAGLKLFGEIGYNNTNTVEIAKEAGVSTGIIYSYFPDKKAILLEVISLHINSIAKPIYGILEALKPPLELEQVVESLIHSFVESHRIGQSIHNELISMAYLDKDVKKYIDQYDTSNIQTLENIFKNLGCNSDNMSERVYIAYKIVDDFCHEVIYCQHDNLDSTIMKSMCIKVITMLLTQ